MPLRTVFFGTPAFAVPSLERLLAGDHEVAAVVTQPDRPAGRGRKLRASPVKEVALSHGLPVLQPTRLRRGPFAEELARLQPEVGVVVAYGRILPPAILEVPVHGHLNVHASLLPRHRGAAPIERALLAGDARTGVSLMRLTEGLDEGPVLLTREIEIEPDDDAGSLAVRLAALGADALLDALAAVEDGSARFEPQPEEGVTHAPPISTAEAWIDWTEPARRVADRVRAMQPRPGARTRRGGELLKLHRVRVADGDGPGSEPGAVVDTAGDGPRIACGRGSVRLLEVQREGRRRQPAREWVNGTRLAVGEVLGGGEPVDG